MQGSEFSIWLFSPFIYADLQEQRIELIKLCISRYCFSYPQESFFHLSFKFCPCPISLSPCPYPYLSNISKVLSIVSIGPPLLCTQASSQCWHAVPRIFTPCSDMVMLWCLHWHLTLPAHSPPKPFWNDMVMTKWSITFFLCLDMDAGGKNDVDTFQGCLWTQILLKNFHITLKNNSSEFWWWCVRHASIQNWEWKVPS